MAPKVVVAQCYNTRCKTFRGYSEQHGFKKGCVELDDVIHNTLGCLIGFALWWGLAKYFFGIQI